MFLFICFCCDDICAAKLRITAQKTKRKTDFPLLFSRFFVTLEEFSAFLCIKAVWGIEEKLGYELETVLNSTFCYKLRQRTPDAEPATVL